MDGFHLDGPSSPAYVLNRVAPVHSLLDFKFFSQYLLHVIEVIRRPFSRNSYVFFYSP